MPTLLATAAGALAVVSLFAMASMVQAQTPTPQAPSDKAFSQPANVVVDAKHTGAAGAVVDGKPVYATIGAALDAAPEAGDRTFVISIRDGRYYEKLVVAKPRIAFIGQSRDGTVITYDAWSGLKKADGTTWSTSGSGTVIVRAPDFIAENLTIENGYDYNSNDKKAKDDPTKTNAPQAVALMTDKGSDRAYFRNIKLMGFQDTLFTNTGRAYFKNCVIAGHIDFIFGAGQSLFEECDIITRARPSMAEMPIGYVSAPSTQIAMPYGLVFDRCRLLKEPGVPAQSSPLGRPWHPTTTFADGRYADPNAIGSSVYLNTWMDDHITVDGWDRMSGTGRQPNTKDWFLPEDSRFFEYASSGPGAHASPKRRQLTADQAKTFAKSALFGDWQP